MKSVHVVHLYAKEMNIYGDNGNVMILQKRLQWRGIKTKLTRVNLGDNIPQDADIIIGGGGQDASQSAIAKDIKKKQDTLGQMQKNGVVMLMICGMYQLFGHYFITQNKQTITGIGLIDMYTIAGTDRLIGNITTDSDWGKIVGYENHSGKSYLGTDTIKLGLTSLGQGNNGEDKTEGAIKDNVFGSYMHGPILAKSPQFADHLIKKTLIVKGYDANKLETIDDSMSLLAQKYAISRSR